MEGYIPGKRKRGATRKNVQDITDDFQMSESDAGHLMIEWSLEGLSRVQVLPGTCY
jgi:hypothetical protein